MSFLESRTNSVFLKAWINLWELENVKEYDTEMKVMSEYKVIKLKDSVLKDYISKFSKERVQVIKNSNTQSNKKNLGIASPPKSGSQTARVKGTVSSSLPFQSKKDSFFISSLMSVRNFLQKRNRNIILILIDKMVEKYCSWNFENLSDTKNAKTKWCWSSIYLYLCYSFEYSQQNCKDIPKYGFTDNAL